jgi:hypothetical protein
MKTLYRGALGYIDPSTDIEHGREWFHGVHHRDGSMTHSAMVHWTLDNGSIIKRDVTVSVDGNFRAIDCYNRIELDDVRRGSALFRFDDHGVSCDADTEQYGKVRQRLDYDGKPAIFTTHPVTCDAWATAPFDHSKSDKTQRFNRVVHTSPTPDGTTGPMLGIWDIEVTYYGASRITVPAGTFDTEYYTFSILDKPEWAPLHTYVMGPRRQLARLYWETLNLNFDLVEIEEIQIP